MCKYTRTPEHNLEYFCQEIQNLRFSQKPNYDRLRQILRGLIQFENQKDFERIEKLENNANMYSRNETQTHGDDNGDPFLTNSTQKDVQ